MITKIFKLPLLATLLVALLATGCESIKAPGSDRPTLKPRTTATRAVEEAPMSTREAIEASPDYVIGPLDKLQIFVWRAPELSQDVTVRPDGRLSSPLIDDMVAAGKTPSQLAQDIEVALSTYVKAPDVTVIVSQFGGTFDQQVRVLGEA